MTPVSHRHGHALLEFGRPHAGSLYAPFCGLCAGAPGPEFITVLRRPEDIREFWLSYTWTGAVSGVLLLIVLVALTVIEAGGYRTNGNAAHAIAHSRGR